MQLGSLNGMWTAKREKIGHVVLHQMLEFKVDGTARGKPCPVSIGVLQNDKGVVLYMYSKNMGIRDSIEAKVLAILEAFWIFATFFRGRLIVQGDSSKAVL